MFGFCGGGIDADLGVRFRVCPVLPQTTYYGATGCRHIGEEFTGTSAPDPVLSFVCR